MAPAKRLIEWALITVLAVSGIVIGWRILAGPLSFPLRVNSPLNSESWFGLAVVLLLLVRATPASPAAGSGRKRLLGLDALAVAAIVVTVAAAYRRATENYFVSDDFILMKYAAEPWRHFVANFTIGGGDGFYRPVADSAFGLLSSWAALDPVRWHSLGLA